MDQSGERALRARVFYVLTSFAVLCGACGGNRDPGGGGLEEGGGASVQITNAPECGWQSKVRP